MIHAHFYQVSMSHARSLSQPSTSSLYLALCLLVYRLPHGVFALILSLSISALILSDRVLFSQLAAWKSTRATDPYRKHFLVRLLS